MVNVAGPDRIIKVRNLKIDAKPLEDERWYINGDPVATAFFNALTITFPQGEKFFVETVRRYHQDMPQPLSDKITTFIQQQALHTREHSAFNRQLETSGYDVANSYRRISKEINRCTPRSPIGQLGLTIALEHLTALLAHELLAKPHHLKNMPDGIKQLWQWHALAEIEHKGIAFDTFLFATRDWSSPRRWLFRAWAMFETSFRFTRVLVHIIGDLYAQDGLKSWSMTLRTLNYLLGPKGVMRPMAKGWLAWFVRGFHPSHRDDTPLIAIYAAKFVGVQSR